MGKIYVYRVDIGGHRAEVICTTKAEANKRQKADSDMSFGKIMIKTTPYAVVVR